MIRKIYDLLARDEARHGGAYLQYMKRALTGDAEAPPERSREIKSAFARTGMLMAAAGRAGKPLHPTNLHVNKALFPNDTVQSRLPDPDWLEHWLDEQIRFDEVWEKKVIERILHNMSLLFERTFESVQDLNRYRKELNANLQAAQA